MPNPDNKLPENEPGRYYVDSQCIDCDVCRDIAPDNFTRKTDKGYSFVYQQPGSEKEEILCLEAMEACPVEAIGNNGKQERS
jgi:ferredoxin